MFLNRDYSLPIVPSLLQHDAPGESKTVQEHADLHFPSVPPPRAESHPLRHPLQRGPFVQAKMWVE